METILILILIIILGYAGAHLHFYQSKLPLGTRYVFFAGSEYLFLGLLLGSERLALLTPDKIELLSPVLNLGLGWIGFLFGLQFEWSQLRRLPLRFLGITVIQAFFTLVLLWTGLILLSGYLNRPLSGAGVLILAAVASISSPTCLVFIQKYTVLPRSVGRLVHYVSSLDSVVGLLVFGLVHFLYMADLFHQWWLNFPVYLALGALLILLFHLLTRFKINDQELLILTVGLIVFSSGVAGVFNLSALLLNFFLGVGLINLTSLNHRTLARIIHAQEKSIYIIFLLFAGAMWTPSTTSFLLLTVYFGLRLAGKLLGSVFAVRLYRLEYTLPAFWGLSLTPQGGMGIAMVVDYLQYHPGDAGMSILNIILITTLISQLLGPFVIRLTIGREGAA